MTKHDWMTLAIFLGFTGLITIIGLKANQRAANYRAKAFQIYNNVNDKSCTAMINENGRIVGGNCK